MKKFTKVNKQKETTDDINLKYQGNDLNIINYKDWDIITGKDKIAILPYLKDDGYILLKYENIPTYNYKLKDNQIYKNVFNFLTIIKSDILNNESLTNSVRRVLLNDCGISLSQNYPINVDKQLFKDEKNTGQYYISLLELNYNDFKQVTAKTNDVNNKVIKISLGEIDNIKTFDIITDYLLLKLKYEYKI
jgi:hypothetical protein